MKKPLLTILVLAMIATITYAQRKKHHALDGKEILSISMSHGGCYGRCPIYNIDIAKDGMVTYKGIRFVKDTGIFKKNVGVARVKQLFEEFYAYRVDTCSAAYRNRIPDISGTYYTIVYKDKTQKISNANFGPVFFNELTSDVNKIAVVDATWKKVIK